MSGKKLDVDDLSKEVAKLELGENPATKVNQIEAIKKWIITHDWIECRTDDEFILRFLRVSKFSCEAAKERIEKFCVARTSKLDGMPEWFEDQDTKNAHYREILETGVIYPLGEPDANGRLVVFTNWGVGAKFEPMMVGRAGMMMFDYLMAKYPRLQINGMHMLENQALYTKEQMMYWNLERVPKAINMMQGAMPVRIKSMDWYSLPMIFRLIMEAGMAIMRAKIKERLTIHAKHEDHPKDIPEHIIPPVIGGKGPAFDTFKKELLDDLFSYQLEFDMLKMCKINENKRPKKVYQGDSWGITGTYIQTGTQ